MNKRKVIMIIVPVVVTVSLLAYLWVSGKIKFKADTNAGTVLNTATATYTTPSGQITVESNQVSVPVQLGEPEYGQY